MATHTLRGLFAAIADAIRAKTGESADIVADNFPTAIAAIPKGATLGEKSISQNGTYNASDDSLDGYSKVSVNVASAGDYTAGDFVDYSKPTGAIVSTINQDGQYDSTIRPMPNSSGITSVSFPNTKWLPSNFAQYCSNLSQADCPSLVGLNSNAFRSSGLVNAIFPSLKTIAVYAFKSCNNLEAVDIGKNVTSQGTIYGDVFSGCSKLNVVVLRASAVYTLYNIAVFNNTPFASDGTGGILYVPNDLIASYQAATNWSTILGYANNQIKSIESTHTDPDAPIDLTLYYADGTAIPTTQGGAKR